MTTLTIQPPSRPAVFAAAFRFLSMAGPGVGRDHHPRRMVPILAVPGPAMPAAEGRSTGSRAEKAAARNP